MILKKNKFFSYNIALFIYCVFIKCFYYRLIETYNIYHEKRLIVNKFYSIGGIFVKKLRHRSNPDHMGELDDDSFIKCDECGTLLAPWETFDSKYCKKCSEIFKEAKKNSLHRCIGCNNFFHSSELHNNYCISCLKKLKICKKCGDKCIPDKFSLCTNCHDDFVEVCKICKKEFIKHKKSDVICPSCDKKKKSIHYNESSKTNSDSKKSGENNDRTIELLIKALSDEESRPLAEKNLAKMGYNSINSVIDLFNSKNKTIRKSAIKILVLMDEISIDSLIIALKDIEYQIRKNSAKTLGKIGNIRAVDPLIESLSDSDSYVRSNSAKALGRIGDNSAVDNLIDSLEDSNLYVRISSVDALGSIADSKATEALIETLNDGNHDLRIASIQALGEIGDENALTNLSMYITDHNSVIADFAKNAIIKISGQEGLDKLIEKIELEETIENNTTLNKEEFIVLINDLSNQNPSVRSEAVIKLGNAKHEKSVGYLIKTLDNEDNAEVKIEILNSLGKLKDINSLDSIINSSIDENLAIRITAEEVIVDFGSVAIDALSDALKNDDDEIRYVSVVCLCQIEDEQVLDLLIENYDDSDPDVKVEIIKGLKKNKEQKAIIPLLELIKDNDLNVSKNAVKALISIGNEIVLSGLKECVNELDYPIKNKIERAIKKIEKRIDSQNSSEKEDKNTLGSNPNSDDSVNNIVNYDNNGDIEFKDSKKDDEEDDPFDLLDQIKNL